MSSKSRDSVLSVSNVAGSQPGLGLIARTGFLALLLLASAAFATRAFNASVFRAGQTAIEKRQSTRISPCLCPER